MSDDGDPGSHKGPTYDHHEGPYFCGAMDLDKCDVDFTRRAADGTGGQRVTIHHACPIHGSLITGRPVRGVSAVRLFAVDARPLHDPGRGGSLRFRIVRASRPALQMK
jgi:hypothetical protein